MLEVLSCRVGGREDRGVFVSDQDPEGADPERFVGSSWSSPNPCQPWRTSLSDFSCFGDTYGNMTGDFNVSVQKEIHNSTSQAF